MVSGLIYCTRTRKCCSNFEFSFSVVVIIVAIFVLPYNCALGWRIRSDTFSGPTLENGDIGKKENVELRVVSQLRHRRELFTKDFHIIELTRPHQNNSKMHIHLYRNEHLFAPNFQFIVNDGESRQVVPELSTPHTHQNSNGHCLYSGLVTSVSMAGSTSSYSEEVEHVTLTSCGDHPGFTGVIMTQEGNYILEPQRSNRHKRDSDDSTNSSSLSIPHTLTPLDSSKEEEAIRTCGGAVEPPADLLKVAVSTSDSDSDSDSYAQDPRLGSRNLDSSSTAEVNEDGRQISSNGFSWTSNSNSNWNKKPLALKSGSGLSTRAASSKSKGSIHNVKESRPVVNIKVWGDKEFYEMMKKKLNTNSMKVIKNYIVTVVQMTAILYEHPSLKTPVDLYLSAIEVMKQDPPGFNSQHAHGLLNPFLDEFCRWAGKFSEDGHAFDHAMLLTGQDLRIEGGGGDAVGVAFLEGMCTLSLSCSVIEQKGYGVCNTMAHELGHSLGMSHDGQDQNKACDAGAYIMGAYHMPKQTGWSTCSNDNISKFLAGKGKLSRMFYRDNCLKKEDKAAKYTFSTKKNFPGETISADDQCKATFGTSNPTALKDAKYYPTLKNYDICKELYCQDQSLLQVAHSHAALEGTNCAKSGSGKWCRRGECVKKT